MSELWRLSAAELATRIRARDVSAREAAESALQRLDAVNPKVNAVVAHRPEWSVFRSSRRTTVRTCVCSRAKRSKRVAHRLHRSIPPFKQVRRLPGEASLQGSSIQPRCCRNAGGTTPMAA